MNKGLIEVVGCEETVLNTLRQLKDGNIEDALAEFAETFSFNDRALGLDFTDKEQLREFFRKERELYPDSSCQITRIVAAGEYVVAEWLMEYSIKEPFYGNIVRDVPVSVQGVSIVRSADGKITEWRDYYDGLVSRRSALTSYFTDWIEY
jgi:steroid delta-isomerase-like uncharacterized protein